MITESYHTRFHHSEGRDNKKESGLSMVLAPAGMQFALFDGGFRKLEELGHIALPPEAGPLQSGQLEFLLRNYRLPGLKYTRVIASVLHGDFSITPPVFSSAIEAGALLDFGGRAEQGRRSNRTTVANAEFNFGTDSAMQQVLEQHFSNCTIRHAGIKTVQLLFSHHSLQGCNVLLNVHEGMIELAARENEALLFYNVFVVSGNEDILYYLLFMAEQFGLSGDSIRLGLSGPEPADGDLIRMIRRFAPGLRLVANDPGIQLAAPFASIPSHYYFLLLNQHLCAL